MRLFLAITAQDRVLGAFADIASARAWAGKWVDLSGADRRASGIVEVERESGAIRPRSDRLNRSRVIVSHAL